MQYKQNSNYDEHFFNIIINSQKNLEFLINYSTSKGVASLILKNFGRGVDFLCRDNNLNNSGGVHII